jgi:hypothetical protein
MMPLSRRRGRRRRAASPRRMESRNGRSAASSSRARLGGVVSPRCHPFGSSSFRRPGRTASAGVRGTPRSWRKRTSGQKPGERQAPESRGGRSAFPKLAEPLHDRPVLDNRPVRRPSARLAPRAMSRRTRRTWPASACGTPSATHGRAAPGVPPPPSGGSSRPVPAPPGLADIDAGARGEPGPEPTDMNRELRRAAGREPAITHSHLLRGL